jgi:hypothetical protein
MKDFLKKLAKSLKTFPMGVMMLVISYILVYFWDGEARYLTALSSLTSIKTLIYEVVVAGLAYSILSLLYLYAIPCFQKIEERGLRYGDLLRYLAVSSFIIIGISIFMFIESVTAIEYTFDGEVEVVFFGMSLIIIIFSAVYYCVSQMIETRIINKSLKALREKGRKGE